jgi:hypothetical protein
MAYRGEGEVRIFRKVFRNIIGNIKVKLID